MEGGFFLPDEVREAIVRDGALAALRKWRGYRPLELSLRSNVRLARIVGNELRNEGLNPGEHERLAKALRVPLELLAIAGPRHPRLRVVPNEK